MFKGIKMSQFGYNVYRHYNELFSRSWELRCNEVSLSVYELID